MANGDRTYISWKWIVWLLITIVFGATSLIINDTRIGISEAKTRIEMLQKEKVDKEQYQCDIKEIKDGLNFLIKREMRENR